MAKWKSLAVSSGDKDRRNCDLSMLQMKMQTGSFNLANSLKVSYKVKHIPNTWPVDFDSGIYSSEVKTKTYTNIHAVLFIVCPN